MTLKAELLAREVKRLSPEVQAPAPMVAEKDIQDADSLQQTETKAKDSAQEQKEKAGVLTGKCGSKTKCGSQEACYYKGSSCKCADSVTSDWSTCPTGSNVDPSCCR
mmetsp:Transcript_64203/g.123526  ORF Transcript_64203/g.123526 Transcript_64203/m.123526 type:complete len:107 (-) Transcript_64203:232-552(-)